MDFVRPLFRLVENNWNDDRDVNGWQLCGRNVTNLSGNPLSDSA